jgi:DNA-binding NarL/FixJ family response regulator
MEIDPFRGSQKILLIGGDEALSGSIVDLLHPIGIVVAPTIDAGLALAAVDTFLAVLFEIPQANTAALFQITRLTTRAARLPVLAIGPNEDDSFFAEVIYSGAQEYLGRSELNGQQLRRAIFSATARQLERLALMKRKIITEFLTTWLKASSARRLTAIISSLMSRWPESMVTARRWI